MTQAKGSAETKLAWELASARAIADLASSLLAAEDADAASTLVNAAARQITGSPMGCSPYVDPVTDRVVIPALRNAPAIPADPGAVRPVCYLVSDLWHWSLSKPQPLLVNQPGDNPLPPPATAFDSPLPRFICAPAMVGDTLLGLVMNGGSDNDYVTRDLDSLQRLASIYAMTLRRHWAEQALRGSEARHRSLYEGVPVGLYRTTPDGQIVDANPALLELLGTTDRERLLSVPATELYVDPAERERQCSQLAKDDVIHGIEMALRRLDGKVIWVRNTMRAVREDGEIRFHEGALENVTARKAAEAAEQAQRQETEALRETAAALSSANTLDRVYDLVLERVGKLVPCDAASTLVIVGDQAEVARVRRFDRNAPIDWDSSLSLPLAEMPHLLRIVENGEVLVIADTHSFMGWRPTPESDWIRSAVIAPIRAKGGVIGFLSLDSSQQDAFDSEHGARLQAFADQVGSGVENARLFQAAVDERARLNALIATDPSGTIFIDTSQQVLVINQAALDMLQLPGDPEDWLGRDVKALIDEVAKSDESVAETLRVEVTGLGASETSTRSGEFTTNQLSLQWSNQIVETGGLSLGRLILLRDTTAERAVGRLREEMSHMLVHDLRNPLGVVLNAIQLLAPDQPHGLLDEQRQILDIAQAGAERLMSLVNRILEMAHLESGRLPLRLRTWRLDQVIDAVIRQENPLADARAITIECNLAPDLPAMYGDEDLIFSVLQNLVDNALKFSTESGVVRVNARPHEAEEGRSLCIAVANKGEGVPPELAPRLFQKFARGNQSGRGTGLGLAFCKLAVEAHGGKIWNVSGEDGWTEFAFSLPLSESASA